MTVAKWSFLMKELESSSCHNVFDSSVNIIKLKIETLLLSLSWQHTLSFQHYLCSLSQQCLHTAYLGLQAVKQIKS